MMGDVKRRLEPQSSQQIAVNGSTIYVRDVDGPARIVFDGAAGNESVTVRTGDKLRAQRPFDHFRIENPGEGGVNVDLVVTSGDFDQRITGAVEIRDSVPLRVNVAERSLPDRPYLRRSQTMIAPLAADLIGVLYNPMNSGVFVLDPVITISDKETFRVQMQAFDAIADLPIENHGWNKNTEGGVRASRGRAYVKGWKSERFAFHEREDVGDRLKIANIATSTRTTRLQLSHGGGLIAPGTGVQYEIMERSQELELLDVFVMVQWIEQPIGDEQ